MCVCVCAPTVQYGLQQGGAECRFGACERARSRRGRRNAIWPTKTDADERDATRATRTHQQSPQADACSQPAKAHRGDTRARPNKPIRPDTLAHNTTENAFATDWLSGVYAFTHILTHPLAHTHTRARKPAHAHTYARTHTHAKSYISVSRYSDIRNRVYRAATSGGTKK